MLTDIFLTRHPRTLFYSDNEAYVLASFFTQILHVLGDLERPLALDEIFFRSVHDRLARELGVHVLVRDQRTYAHRVAAYLGAGYDLWNNDHGPVDSYLKSRFSMVELLFRSLDERVREREAKHEGSVKSTGLFRFAAAKSTALAPIILEEREALNAGISELNTRLREHRVGLIYHNGFLHFASDAVSTDRVHTPFWAVLAASKWQVADEEMKEAVEHLDRSDQDAAVHALCALESVLKIICEDRNWSTGKEKGAVNYIENLQGARSGHFIAGWEADALRALFRDIRNPRSHGGGSTPPTPLNAQQLMWAVDVSMTWIKSLVARL